MHWSGVWPWTTITVRVSEVFCGGWVLAGLLPSVQHICRDSWRKQLAAGSHAVWQSERICQEEWDKLLKSSCANLYENTLSCHCCQKGLLQSIDLSVWIPFVKEIFEYMLELVSVDWWDLSVFTLFKFHNIFWPKLWSTVSPFQSFCPCSLIMRHCQKIKFDWIVLHKMHLL